MLDNTTLRRTYPHADRYDGQVCTIHLADGTELTGRAYAPLGWADNSETRRHLRIVHGTQEHWISPTTIGSTGVTEVDATGVLTVGQRVRLVEDFHWHDRAYQGAEVEIVEIGHSNFSQPYNSLYIVAPVKPGARHTHLSVSPRDIAETFWFAQGPDAGSDDCDGALRPVRRLRVLR
ncbi:hypothetical protein ACIA49_39125 [Kribbella sp. NPDC051587]|uniref:hypothetical protein n=1 Tax=Kribbella sp. NPDC051587 TaxID=3364119 RepID=UPI0037943A11